MRPAPMETVGALVMTVWMEDPQPGGLRARLTHSLDVSAMESSVSAAAGVDEITVFIRRWLETFVATASTAPHSRADREA